MRSRTAVAVSEAGDFRALATGRRQVLAPSVVTSGAVVMHMPLAPLALPPPSKLAQIAELRYEKLDLKETRAALEERHVQESLAELDAVIQGLDALVSSEYEASSSHPGPPHRRLEMVQEAAGQHQLELARVADMLAAADSAEDAAAVLTGVAQGLQGLVQMVQQCCEQAHSATGELVQLHEAAKQLPQKLRGVTLGCVPVRQRFAALDYRLGRAIVVASNTAHVVDSLHDDLARILRYMARWNALRSSMTTAHGLDVLIIILQCGVLPAKFNAITAIGSLAEDADSSFALGGMSAEASMPKHAHRWGSSTSGGCSPGEAVAGGQQTQQQQQQTQSGYHVMDMLMVCALQLLDGGLRQAALRALSRLTADVPQAGERNPGPQNQGRAVQAALHFHPGMLPLSSPPVGGRGRGKLPGRGGRAPAGAEKYLYMDTLKEVLSRPSSPTNTRGAATDLPGARPGTGRPRSPVRAARRQGAGLKQLLKLLESSRGRSPQPHTLTLVSNLARRAENVSLLVRAGLVEILLDMAALGVAQPEARHGSSYAMALLKHTCLLSPECCEKLPHVSGLKVLFEVLEEEALKSLHTDAACCLEAILDHAGANRQELLRRITVVGGTPMLISSIQLSAERGLQKTCAALTKLLVAVIQLGPEQQRGVGLEGGIPVLVQLLAYGPGQSSIDMMVQAAWAVSSLCLANPTNQSRLATNLGIEALIRCLDLDLDPVPQGPPGGHSVAMLRAAAAEGLASACDNNPAIIGSIAERCDTGRMVVVEPLLAMLGDGAAVQEHCGAAQALMCLCQDSSGLKARVLAGDGLAKLKRCLLLYRGGSRTEASSRRASGASAAVTGALVNLLYTVGGQDTLPDLGSEVAAVADVLQDPKATLSMKQSSMALLRNYTYGDPNRSACVSALPGLLQRLAELVSCRDADSAAPLYPAVTRRVALELLTNLMQPGDARADPEVMQIIQCVVADPQDAPDVRGTAAGALGASAGQKQPGVPPERAMKPLVDLLTCGDASAAATTAGVLATLAEGRDFALECDKTGLTAALVKCLSTSSGKAVSHSIAALTNIASHGDEAVLEAIGRTGVVKELLAVLSGRKRPFVKPDGTTAGVPLLWTSKGFVSNTDKKPGVSGGNKKAGAHDKPAWERKRQGGSANTAGTQGQTGDTNVAAVDSSREAGKPERPASPRRKMARDLELQEEAEAVKATSMKCLLNMMMQRDALQPEQGNTELMERNAWRIAAARGVETIVNALEQMHGQLCSGSAADLDKKRSPGPAEKAQAARRKESRMTHAGAETSADGRGAAGPPVTSSQYAAPAQLLCLLLARLAPYDWVAVGTTKHPKDVIEQLVQLSCPTRSPGLPAGLRAAALEVLCVLSRMENANKVRMVKRYRLHRALEQLIKAGVQPELSPHSMQKAAGAAVGPSGVEEGEEAEALLRMACATVFSVAFRCPAAQAVLINDGYDAHLELPGAPLPPNEQVLAEEKRIKEHRCDIIPLLARCLTANTGSGTKVMAASAVWVLAGASRKGLQRVLDTQVVDTIVKMLPKNNSAAAASAGYPKEHASEVAAQQQAAALGLLSILRDAEVRSAFVRSNLPRILDMIGAAALRAQAKRSQGQPMMPAEGSAADAVAMQQRFSSPGPELAGLWVLQRVAGLCSPGCEWSMDLLAMVLEAGTLEHLCQLLDRRLSAAVRCAAADCVHALLLALPQLQGDVCTLMQTSSHPASDHAEPPVGSLVVRLVRALQDPDSMMRQAAVQALFALTKPASLARSTSAGGLGTGSPRKHLEQTASYRERMAASPTSQLCQAILQVKDRQGKECAIRQVVGMMQDESGEGVRRAAMALLSNLARQGSEVQYRIASHGALRLLVRLTGDGREPMRVRCQAAQLLGMISRSNAKYQSSIGGAHGLQSLLTLLRTAHAEEMKLRRQLQAVQDAGGSKGEGRTQIAALQERLVTLIRKQLRELKDNPLPSRTDAREEASRGSAEDALNGLLGLLSKSPPGIPDASAGQQQWRQHLSVLMRAVLKLEFLLQAVQHDEGMAELKSRFLYAREMMDACHQMKAQLQALLRRRGVAAGGSHMHQEVLASSRTKEAAVDALVQLLEGHGPNQRRVMGEKGNTLGLLVLLLNDPNIRVRETVAQLLGHLGSKYKQNASIIVNDHSALSFLRANMQSHAASWGSSGSPARSFQDGSQGGHTEAPPPPVSGTVSAADRDDLAQQAVVDCQVAAVMAAASLAQHSPAHQKLVASKCLDICVMLTGHPEARLQAAAALALQRMCCGIRPLLERALPCVENLIRNLSSTAQHDLERMDEYEASAYPQVQWSRAGSSRSDGTVGGSSYLHSEEEEGQQQQRLVLNVLSLLLEFSGEPKLHRLLHDSDSSMLQGLLSFIHPDSQVAFGAGVTRTVPAKARYTQAALQLLQKLTQFSSAGPPEHVRLTAQRLLQLEGQSILETVRSILDHCRDGDALKLRDLALSCAGNCLFLASMEGEVEQPLPQNLAVDGLFREVKKLLLQADECGELEEEGAARAQEPSAALQASCMYALAGLLPYAHFATGAPGDADLASWLITRGVDSHLASASAQPTTPEQHSRLSLPASGQLPQQPAATKVPATAVSWRNLAVVALARMAKLSDVHQGGCSTTAQQDHFPRSGLGPSAVPDGLDSGGSILQQLQWSCGAAAAGAAGKLRWEVVLDLSMTSRSPLVADHAAMLLNQMIVADGFSGTPSDHVGSTASGDAAGKPLVLAVAERVGSWKACAKALLMNRSTPQCFILGCRLVAQAVGTMAPDNLAKEGPIRLQAPQPGATGTDKPALSPDGPGEMELMDLMLHRLLPDRLAPEPAAPSAAAPAGLAARHGLSGTVRDQERAAAAWLLGCVLARAPRAAQQRLVDSGFLERSMLLPMLLQTPQQASPVGSYPEAAGAGPGVLAAGGLTPGEGMRDAVTSPAAAAALVVWKLRYCVPAVAASMEALQSGARTVASALWLLLDRSAAAGCSPAAACAAGSIAALCSSSRQLGGSFLQQERDTWSQGVSLRIVEAAEKLACQRSEVARGMRPETRTAVSMVGGPAAVLDAEASSVQQRSEALRRMAHQMASCALAQGKAAAEVAEAGDDVEAAMAAALTAVLQLEGKQEEGTIGAVLAFLQRLLARAGRGVGDASARAAAAKALSAIAGGQASSRSSLPDTHCLQMVSCLLTAVQQASSRVMAPGSSLDKKATASEGSSGTAALAQDASMPALLDTLAQLLGQLGKDQVLEGLRDRRMMEMLLLAASSPNSRLAQGAMGVLAKLASCRGAGRELLAAGAAAPVTKLLAAAPSVPSEEAAATVLMYLLHCARHHHAAAAPDWAAATQPPPAVATLWEPKQLAEMAAACIARLSSGSVRALAPCLSCLCIMHAQAPDIMGRLLHEDAKALPAIVAVFARLPAAASLQLQEAGRQQTSETMELPLAGAASGLLLPAPSQLRRNLEGEVEADRAARDSDRRWPGLTREAAAAAQVAAAHLLMAMYAIGEAQPKMLKASDSLTFWLRIISRTEELAVLEAALVVLALKTERSESASGVVLQSGGFEQACQLLQQGMRSSSVSAAAGPEADRKLLGSFGEVLDLPGMWAAPLHVRSAAAALLQTLVLNHAQTRPRMLDALQGATDSPVQSLTKLLAEAVEGFSWAQQSGSEDRPGPPGGDDALRLVRIRLSLEPALRILGELGRGSSDSVAKLLSFGAVRSLASAIVHLSQADTADAHPVRSPAYGLAQDAVPEPPGTAGLAQTSQERVAAVQRLLCMRAALLAADHVLDGSSGEDALLDFLQYHPRSTGPSGTDPNTASATLRALLAPLTSASFHPPPPAAAPGTASGTTAGDQAASPVQELEQLQEECKAAVCVLLSTICRCQRRVLDSSASAPGPSGTAGRGGQASAAQDVVRMEMERVDAAGQLQMVLAAPSSSDGLRQLVVEALACMCSLNVEVIRDHTNLAELLGLLQSPAPGCDHAATVLWQASSFRAGAARLLSCGAVRHCMKVLDSSRGPSMDEMAAKLLQYMADHSSSEAAQKPSGKHGKRAGAPTAQAAGGGAKRIITEGGAKSLLQFLDRPQAGSAGAQRARVAALAALRSLARADLECQQALVQEDAPRILDKLLQSSEHETAQMALAVLDELKALYNRNQARVADSATLRQAITTLTMHERWTVATQIEAVEMLRVVTDRAPHIAQRVVEQGGLAALQVAMLRSNKEQLPSDSDSAQAFHKLRIGAALCLHAIAQHDPDLQRKMVQEKVHENALLVAKIALEKSDPQAQAAAVQLLTALCSSKENVAAIKAASAFQVFQKQMEAAVMAASRGHPDTTAMAASVLQSLARHDETLRSTIVANTGMDCWIQLLTAEKLKAKEAALRMCQSIEGFSRHRLELPSVHALLAIMANSEQDGDDAAREAAAELLANWAASSTENLQQIIAADGVRKAIAMLKSRHDTQFQHIPLMFIAQICGTAAGQGESATAKADPAAQAREQAAAGLSSLSPGISDMLQHGPERLQEAAALVVAGLASQRQMQMLARKGVEDARALLQREQRDQADQKWLIGRLRALLAQASAAPLKAAAAKAVGALVQADPQLRRDVVDVMGVDVLISLLKIDQPICQEAGARAIAEVAADPAHQVAVEKAGGMEVLKKLVSSEAAGVKGAAMAALTSLAVKPTKEQEAAARPNHRTAPPTGPSRVGIQDHGVDGSGAEASSRGAGGGRPRKKWSGTTSTPAAVNQSEGAGNDPYNSSEDDDSDYGRGDAASMEHGTRGQARGIGFGLDMGLGAVGIGGASRYDDDDDDDNASLLV